MTWIFVILGTFIGAGVGYFIRKYTATKNLESLEAKAQKIMKDAKEKEKDILLNAKEKAIKIIDESKAEEHKTRKDLDHQKRRLEKREETFDQKLLELENKKDDLVKKADEVRAIKKQVEQLKDQQMEKLQKIADLSLEDAKQVLLDMTEKKMKDVLAQRIKKLKNQEQDELEKQAKGMLSTVIQRVAAPHTAETTTTVVNLPSEDMKGRIIGREGRNIKTVEQLTGVEIIVDDTPEAIVVSGFNPLRRHLAKRTLDALILDGRIHPARIEEFVNKAKKELVIDIKKAGEDAAYEVGVAGLPPKIIHLLGRLKYRTSYGQNVLRHSVEVSILSGMLASELGANVPLAKKGGLLHDIGKAIDHEVEGTHPDLGSQILKKYKLPDEVAYIAQGHHDDAPETLECVIAKVADAISGSRIGARKDTYENYIQRLGELEEIATREDGVNKAFAIQAGRELRVFVNADDLDDMASMKMAQQIAENIEGELKYPGEIKVNLIREKRIVEFAR